MIGGLLISLATASVWPRRFVSEAVVGYFFSVETARVHPELLKQDFSPYLVHFQNIAFSEQNLLKIDKRNKLFPNDPDFVRVKKMRRSAVMNKIDFSGGKWGNSICCWTLSFGYSDAGVAQRVDSDLVVELILSMFKTDLLQSPCKGPGDCDGNSFQQVEPPTLPSHKTPPFWAFGAVGVGVGLAIGATLELLRRV
jgi:hypothetical protein